MSAPPAALSAPGGYAAMAPAMRPAPSTTAASFPGAAGARALPTPIAGPPPPVFERNDDTGPKGQCLVDAGQAGKPLVMLPWN